MVDEAQESEIRRRVNRAVEKALVKRDKAWVDALHQNSIVDMVDAEESNKTFILGEMLTRYNAP